MITYAERVMFRDRTDAGHRLAEELSTYKDKDAVVYAIPRGGVPVALEVAEYLHASLDLVIVRKVPMPRDPEAGFGAITEDGTLVINDSMVKRLGMTGHDIEIHAEPVRKEMERRNLVYRQTLPPVDVKGKTAIVIDDGLASGYTMIAAMRSLHNRQASLVVAAIPVASGSAYDLVKMEADRLVCLVIARIGWFSVAGFYRRWNDLNDGEVVQQLQSWRARHTQ